MSIDPTSGTVNLPPKNVAKPYKKFGWAVFILFFGIFVAIACTVIVLKYKANDHPAVQFNLESDLNLQFPSSITMCPDTAGNISWHYFDILDKQNTDISGLNSSSTRKIDISHIKEINYDCIIVDLNVKVSKIPAILELAVVRKLILIRIYL